MASNYGGRLLQRCSNSAKAFTSPATRLASVASGSSKLGGLAPSMPSSTSRLARRQRLFSNSRLPLALGCGQSLIPLHSVTASALLKSMLSSEVGQWSCLSEDKSSRRQEVNFIVIYLKFRADQGLGH
ncbi:OLC1v1011189C1 [Oldenlandia corymbosa var. corymbosa]|uniref:OLC1v1011189C1 n=1 Tax=Oldenlandia corymbosa var. corymbosa TaxID=529605 RepID=A0AAV1DW07_OLDCO|nr:OLC1v1011189C1 [Oldenlandia corymbosa var. corymbosa]